MRTAERERFADFLVSRWPGLVRLSYGLTGDRMLAESLAREAFVKACAAWGQVRRLDDPDTYLRRALISACRRHHTGGAPAHEAPPREAPAGEPVPLLPALARLPLRQRAVVLLRYWEELSDSQVAAALRCPRGTVRAEAARALAALARAGALDEQDGT